MFAVSSVLLCAIWHNAGTIKGKGVGQNMKKNPGVPRAGQRKKELIEAYQTFFKSAEYNRSLIEACLDPMVTIGTDGRIMDVNSATENITGRSREELIGTDFSEHLVNPEMDAGYQRVFDTGEVHDYPLEILHRNGRVTPVIYNASLFRDSDGEVAGMIAVVRDMTDVIRTMETNSRMAAIVESSDDAIIGSSLEGIILSWNNSARKMYGFTAEEAVGRHVGIMVPPDLAGEVPWILNKLRRGEGVVHYETIRMRNDGSRLDVSLTLSPIIDVNGRVSGVSTIARDITERKKVEAILHRTKENLEVKVRARTAELNRANEQLQQEIAERRNAETRLATLVQELENVNRELNDFAHVVSHDLKAPLRAISSLAGMFANDYREKLDADGITNIGLLINRVKRMYGLIDGILQYSRIGRVREQREEVDLNEVVSQVIEMLAPPPSIKIVIQNGLPVLNCDRTRMHQVFQNLIENAVKFMDKPEGEIAVGCREAGGLYEFFVSDNGPGIEERHFDRIFKIFQTLRSRDEVESTGIGLAIIKRVVQSYGGNVWLKSTMGSGSTFYFTVRKEAEKV
jgi:PAS domain S-box-containing protein